MTTVSSDQTGAGQAAPQIAINDNILQDLLDRKWGDFRNAMRHRHEHLMDLLQLISMAADMAEQAIREKRFANPEEDKWSNAYIRRTHAEKVAEAGTEGGHRPRTPISSPGPS